VKKGPVKKDPVNEESKGLRIGDVAQRAGTTPRTIRYYEEIGLLPPADERVAGAHRTYAESDVERLTGLLQLKSLLGLSLEELKELQAAEDARAVRRQEWTKGVTSIKRRRDILTASLGHLDRQLELVQRRRDEIARFESELDERAANVRKLLDELERTD
jgi:DNA-binding transcriptional MerR regulator